MNRKIMNEQELMEWADKHSGYTGVSLTNLEELFKGMMLVPTKEALLPRAKAIYPIANLAMIIPEHVLVLSQIGAPPMFSSKATNAILLGFIRQYEPDYLDMHTEKK